MKAKYIIFSNNSIDLPVIFNPIIKHEDIEIKGYEAISAGFCTMTRAGWYCFGKSVSLQLEPNKADEMLLNKLEMEI